MAIIIIIIISVHKETFGKKKEEEEEMMMMMGYKSFNNNDRIEIIMINGDDNYFMLKGQGLRLKINTKNLFFSVIRTKKKAENKKNGYVK